MGEFFLQEYSYINCSSVTYAQKSIKLLNRMGINAWSKKVSKHECGCGWVLYVYKSDEQAALNILRENKIPLKPINI